MLTRLYLALIGWLGNRLGRAVRKSAMAPQSLATLNPDLLRQMPPRTRKHWRCFRVLRPLCLLPLLLLAGCNERVTGALIGVAITAGPIGAAWLAVSYARLRWGGAVLRVRGREIEAVEWVRLRLNQRAVRGYEWECRPVRGLLEMPADRHRTLPGAIYAALRGLPLALLLLSSPALACDGMGPCSAHAQTAAQEMGPVEPPDPQKGTSSPSAQEVTSPGLNYDTLVCRRSLQDCRQLVLDLYHEKQPARWPWALVGLLVGALLFVPLGAWVAMRIFGDGIAWALTHTTKWWWLYADSDGNDQTTPQRRWWWQALRDAWRLSREVR